MKTRDQRLGMDRAITRRDFVSGVGVAIGASLLPACTRSGDPIADIAAAYYPPAETGMRGSHPGSFEAVHETVQGRQWSPEKSDEHYDLVVVGAGISGLSAAYIYRRDVDANARILILDNHDDFGGHAKRNEFTIGDRTFIAYGGTMVMDAPRNYPAPAAQVIRELGIDPDRSSEFAHEDLAEKLGIGRVSFFDKETFGADFLASGENGISASYNDVPMSDVAREQLAVLFTDETDHLAGMTPAERREVLEAHSWRDYLAKYAGMGEEVLTFIQKWPHGVWAIGADALPAWMAWSEGYPGFAGMDLGLGDEHEADDSRFFFPDGNASVARLLVRKLVPDVAPGNSMESIATARFDYTTLDRPENPVRVRLSSAVVDLRHQGGRLDSHVDVTYASDNKARTVTAGKVIWAGYHALLPHICPDVPVSQANAFGKSVRAPLVYISVMLRSWRSIADLGIRRAYCPGSFCQTALIAHPVSMGGHRFPMSPDEPMVLHMQHIPLSPGLKAPDQFRAGRQALLEMPFETFERNIREQLGRMLGPAGFDPARDIAGITVNRWPHGYAYSVDEASGDVAWYPESWRHETRPWVEARQRIGNIGIAGTDAASNAMTEAAIEEAHRAVHSLA